MGEEVSKMPRFFKRFGCLVVQLANLHGSENHEKSNVFQDFWPAGQPVGWLSMGEKVIRMPRFFNGSGWLAGQLTNLHGSENHEKIECFSKFLAGWLASWLALHG